MRTAVHLDAIPTPRTIMSPHSHLPSHTKNRNASPGKCKAFIVGRTSGNQGAERT